MVVAVFCMDDERWLNISLSEFTGRGRTYSEGIDRFRGNRGPLSLLFSVEVFGGGRPRNSFLYNEVALR
ncbi:hypothetical protein V6N13_071965 [Hibiscus sabdariffa]